MHHLTVSFSGLGEGISQGSSLPSPGSGVYFHIALSLSVMEPHNWKPHTGLSTVLIDV
jgi:hypothetical protein